jgi:hypothetical protein
LCGHLLLYDLTLLNYDLIGLLGELRHRIGEHDVQLAAIYDTMETILDKKVKEEEILEAWKNRNRIGFTNEKIK